MFKGLSPGLAALMGLTVAGAATPSLALPFTGHNVTIKVGFTSGGAPFLEKSTVVDEFSSEITSADDPFFEFSDFIDIGSDSITLFNDAIGGGGFGLLDIEVDFSANTNIFAAGGASIFQSGSMSVGAVQVLSERVLINSLAWDFGSLTITGIDALSEPPSSSVPEPGALAGLGVGLMGIAGAGAARRRKKSTDKSNE